MLTGRQDVACFNPTDGTWNPMTAPLPSAMFKTVRFRIWIAAAPTGGEFSFSPGIQFSKDGLNWDSAKRLETLVSTLVADRWTDGKSELGWTDKDIEAISGTTARLFVRWGLFCKSAAGTQARPAQAELEVINVTDPNNAGFVTPWKIVYGSTTSADNPVPLCDPLDSARFSEIRIATEYTTGVATDSVCKYQAGIQHADDPTDPADWTWAWTSSVVVNQTSGVLNTAAWEDFSSAVTKPFFRVAFRAQRNTAGSTLTLGRARARIELRKVT